MKKIIYLSALLAALLLLPAPRTVLAQVPAGNPDFNLSGRAAFQFLKIGASARQSGMGEAAVATINDVNAVFWNPGGLSGLRRGELSLSYARWFADMDYVGAAAGFRLGRIGILGLQLAAMGYGDIQEAMVIEGGGGEARTGNTFGGNNLLFGVSFAREFTDRLTIGVTAKTIREQLWDYSATQIAFDVGTVYDVGLNGMRLAMSAQNYSPGSVKWLEFSANDQGYDTPLTFRVGISGTLVGAAGVVDLGPAHGVILSVESINSNDYGDRYHVGTEYSFADFLMIRGGYRFNYSDGNLAAGFGLNANVGGMDMRVDYAFVNYEFLNSPHRLTLTLGF
jgi:hypothetical protein